MSMRILVSLLTCSTRFTLSRSTTSQISHSFVRNYASTCRNINPLTGYYCPREFGTYRPPYSTSSYPCILLASDKMRYEGIQSHYDFRTLTPEDIKAATKIIIQEAKAVYDVVGALSREDINYKTAIKPLIDIERDSSTKGVALQLPSMVALDKGVRDASSDSEKELDEFSVEMSMRKDVFDNIVAFSETEEAKALEGEYKRFVEKSIVNGKRNGLHLSEEKRDEIKKLKKRISELGIDFNKNLNEDTTHLFFDEKDLGGIPADLLNSFERGEDGKCKVTMKYPHFFPVTRKCTNPKTRQIMETTYQSRCKKENTAIIEEIVELRQKQTEILGYENHAAYIQELRMAKNPKDVAKFLDELAVKLQPLWEEEKKVMLDLKEKEAKEVGFEFTNKLDFWDFRYYMAMVEEKLYAVDQEKLKEYFPMEVVTSGLMDIYQKILGLKFTKVEDADVWHDEVELFRVDDLSSGETIGYFYLDLYPRDGKYGHACMMQLQAGCLDDQGNRQKSVVVMITNFSKPSKDKPSLLDHKEVETYFHEFGHVMHGICSKAETERFFGTNVERDFVEAPSQMLENWVWQEEPLRLMSKHYKDGTPLPKEMLDKLVASKKANAGGFNLRQITLATFDQRLHTSPKDTKIDSAALVAKTYKEIVGIDTIPGTNFAAIFGHLVGYDAQYYGYMWSEVFCQDMFETRFAKEGVMNSSTGMDYRNLILAPGGSIDAMDMLKNFLKREPTPDAFLKSKGLSL